MIRVMLQIAKNYKKKRKSLFVAFLLFFPAGFLCAQTGTQSQWFKFQNNRHFSGEQIRNLIGLKIGEKLYAQQLKQKTDLLIRILQEDGYFAARIDSVVWPKNPGEQNPALIYLHEGEPFKIHQLFIFGNKHFSLQKIRRTIRLKPGDIFIPANLKADMKKVLAEYAADGYLLAKIEIQKLDIDYTNNAVDIVLNITENHTTRLKFVQISGNRTTRRTVITRELRIEPGEIVTQTGLDKMKDRLDRLSFIRLTADPQVAFTADSAAVIELNVQEQNSSQLNGVLGYNPKQGNQNGYVSGQLDLQFRNLLGTGRSFLAFWEKRGPVSQSLRLSYEEPYLLGWPLNGEFGFFQNVQDTSFVRRSWHLGFNMYLFENITAGLRVGQESVIPDSIGRALYGLPRSNANRLFVNVGFDSRNHLWNPTHGILYRTSVDFVRKRINPLLAGEKSQQRNFRRVSLDMEYVQPVWPRHVLFIGLHGRQVKIGDEPVPVDELYRLGGAQNLRGYRDDQFLGSQIAWGTLEYRFILEKESRLGLFVDAATIGSRNREGSWSQLIKIGYGFGLRTKTDLGVIGFDYALGEGDSFSQGKIHVRILNRF